MGFLRLKEIDLRGMSTEELLALQRKFQEQAERYAIKAERWSLVAIIFAVLSVVVLLATAVIRFFSHG